MAVENAPARSARDAIWVILAFVLLLFSNGRWLLPIASWLAPVFLLRFTRTQRPRVGLLVAFLAISVANAIIWVRIVPLQGPMYFAITIVLGLSQFIALAIDRLIAPRLRGISATLVFPLAAVSLEFLYSAVSPYGTWGAMAYTQSHDLPLIQSVSVTGLAGIAFLIAWFASTVNAAWETGFDWTRSRRELLPFAVVFVLAHLAGAARLAIPPGDTVRVASFTVTPHPPLDLGDLLFHPRTGAALDSARRSIGALDDSLLAAADREAAAGAKVVFWSECNGVVLESDEKAFIARGEALARERGIYLGMALAPFTPGAGYYENLLVIACPEGRTIARYHKARPVPGDPERGADLHLPVVETAFGRIAGAICFDGDFPALMRDAGRGRAGMLIIPSSDWRAIDPIHTHMAMFRGIENGCSVVRQTNKGLSAATDAYGRVLASADFFHARPYVMVSQVPTRRVRTVYRKVGDLFSWLCVAGLLILAAHAPLARRRPAGDVT
jgi:apolipoprotein N-acyltransferase